MKPIKSLQIATLLSLASFVALTGAADIGTLVLTKGDVHLVHRDDALNHKQFDEGHALWVQTAVKHRDKVYLTVVASENNEQATPLPEQIEAIGMLLDSWGELAVAGATIRDKMSATVMTYTVNDGMVTELVADNGSPIVDISLLDGELVGLNAIGELYLVYPDGTSALLLDGDQTGGANSITRPFEDRGEMVIAFNGPTFKAYTVVNTGNDFAFTPVEVYNDAVQGEVYAKNKDSLVIKGPDGFFEKPIFEIFAATTQAQAVAG